MPPSLKNYRVPTAPFKKLVERYVVEQDTSILMFSKSLGMDESAVRHALKKEKIYFDLADKFVCETYGPMKWQEEPYLTIYWMGKVPPDLSKPVKCENPYCDKWVSIKAHGSHIRHCNHNCRSIASRIRLGKRPLPDAIPVTRCKTCKKVFEKRKTRGRGLRTVYCSKECKSIAKAKRMRLWYAANREREKERSKQYRRRHAAS